MAQATLTAASALQAKSGFERGGPISVTLDAACQEGSTVIIELYGGQINIMDGGMGGQIPDGFSLDACSASSDNAVKYLYSFRKAGVAAGEQSWSFDQSAAPLDWIWHATEWNADLEPISPLEGFSGLWQTSGAGSPGATFSTGTAPPTGNTGRANVVALGYHHWHRSSGADTFGWGTTFTGGFTERDRISWTSPVTLRHRDVWSWAFGTAVGQYGTALDLSWNSTLNADTWASMVVIYAATTYA